MIKAVTILGLFASCLVLLGSGKTVTTYKTYKPTDWVSVYNIKHDGHLFVIAQDSGKNRYGMGGVGVGIIHHPDCNHD